MLDIRSWGPLSRWLRRGDAGPVPPTWRTAPLGHLRTAQDYRAALGHAHIQISADAEGLLHRSEPGFAERKRTIDLATATVAELGFPDGARYADIRARARKLRLGFCPPEVGPALRLAYRDQPHGERLIVAMQMVGDPEDALVFSLDHDDDGLWLDVHDGHLDGFWRAEDVFVFVARPTRRKG
ncbi:hypothetical protein [Rhodovulum sp. PH10]|uniref:hypothetical protein n=1 Tax=Rhodovulum sp. PH10 TaxID=1187851 RepID=UPI000689B1FB|nr:hypothetical protein [Rhodovulum sp. PH10]